jgi:hypothetical protein
MTLLETHAVMSTQYGNLNSCLNFKSDLSTLLSLKNSFIIKAYVP